MQRVHDAVGVPSLEHHVPLERADTKRVKARKRAQLSALLGAASSFARHASRIVDVGAGQGHLTRAASRAWDKDALGLDREASFVSVAKDLALDHRVDFRRWDAFHEDVALEASDLVLGLHACGEVGDVLVKRAAEAKARVLLVSCCPQKVRAEFREPLSRAGQNEELRLPRLVLGLANLSQLEQGVESSLLDTMRSRQTRHGMRILLQHRGFPVRAGEEMRGVNRRRAYKGLPTLAEAVLAFRQLPPASSAELADCERQALAEYGMMRRLSLPRAMFARLVEVAVVLDRATFLQESGYLVEVSTVFDATVSPRNLGIFAAPSPVGKAWR
jgi:SAM-dependent methyltransferase